MHSGSASLGGVADTPDILRCSDDPSFSAYLAPTTSITGRLGHAGYERPQAPERTSETGEVEQAGSNHEVCVDFGWKGPSEGDFFWPFKTIDAAAAVVADAG
jgi:hypothetical protein